MKILIANDGSEFGSAAVEMAANLINCDENSQVKVVTVIEPAGTLEIQAMVESVEELLDPANPLFRRAQEIGKASVERLKAKCKTNCDIRYETLAGAAVPTIIEEAERWNADLIVTGSHGYGLWRRTLLGSVSRRIADHAHCSVLIVRTKDRQKD
jgi:nucleotide-binding universal stress UspA family protein